MRVLYDSTTPARSIPSGAQMVAGYTSGLYPTFPLVCQQWPHAIHVSIAINAAHDAMVLDVERGDADPADAPAWITRQRARGQIPTVYCNTSTWPSVQAACHLAGVALPLWWRADYNGRPALEMGEVAHQYRSDTAQNLDYSVVADHWPGVDPPQEDDMDRPGLITLAFGCLAARDPTADELNNLSSTGVSDRQVVLAALDSPDGTAIKLARRSQAGLH